MEDKKIISQGFLATFLGGVNKQIFKVEFKKLFLFFLVMLFCCNVGESDLI